MLIQQIIKKLRGITEVKDLSPDDMKEFKQEILNINFQRHKKLDFLLFVIFAVLLYTDYVNYKNLLWFMEPGYRLLFYSHLLVLGGMVICGIFYALARLSPIPSQQRFKQIFFLFGSFYVTICAALTSVVDQYLHGEIIVFVICVLAYSIINLQRPLIAVLMYSLAYVVLMAGITLVQEDLTILRGHYINGTLIVILAVFLSTILYYTRIRDLISKKTIERQKAELEQANKELSAANHELRESLAALDESQNIIFTLTLALESKDPNTHGHSERVVNYALALADYLNLSERDKTLLRRAAVLHDIGKIGIPDYILNKPFDLTAEEWKIVKTHPVRGEAICSKLKFAQEILPIIRHHHERFDGSGYPDGLSGDSIPFLARIISIADTVDAITSPRSYRIARSMEYALNELKECSGTQFDPFLAEAFIKIYNSNTSKIINSNPTVAEVKN